MENTKLSVSINPAPLSSVFEYIHKIDNSEADMIHCDVMDGKFVSNFTYSSGLVHQIKKETFLPLDVHLMVDKPSKFLLFKFLRSKPYSLSLHYEAYKDKKVLVKNLQYIYKKGTKAGIAISPKTSVDEVLDILPYCQYVVVMGVEPGKSGQKLIENCLEKIIPIREYYNKLGINDIEIEIDGGINGDNIETVLKLGYDVVVMGSYLYKYPDTQAIIHKVKSL